MKTSGKRFRVVIEYTVPQADIDYNADEGKVRLGTLAFERRFLRDTIENKLADDLSDCTRVTFKVGLAP